MKIRETSFLLILLSSFLILVIYVTNPSLNKPERDGLFVDLAPTIEIVATGDVMLGRTVMTKSLDESDPSYPFRKVADGLSGVDLTFINLENPIIEGCPRHTTGLRFCASPDMVEGLIFAGIDIANLANNHSRNYGQEGINQTVEVLSQNDIEVTGLGDLVIKQVKGTSFGFLGFDLFYKEPNEEVFDLIRESDEKVDILFVGVHWGVEYTDEPTSSQREVAKRMVEVGADVIVGHGPHWVQTSETIDGVPVYYSLGNFVFDQMWSDETRKGLAVKFVFKGRKLIKEEKLPIFMDSWAQPELVEN